MPDDRTHSIERSFFEALSAFILTPIIAAGLWLPLVHVFGAAGTAFWITGTSLVITGIMVVCHHIRPKPILLLALGALLALGCTWLGALGLPGLLTLLSVTVAITALLGWMSPRLPSTLDGLARRHKILSPLYVIIALMSVISLVRLSIFISDATQVDYQTIPGVAFLETHSCLTAYVHAASLAKQGVDNLYSAQWWQGSHGFAPLPEGVASPYRPFILDYYAYPPPFLLVMAPLMPFEGDYAAQRALWFGLNGLLLAFSLGIVSRWLEGPGSHRILLLSPIFLASLPILATLQVGNFQIAVVVSSVLAMLAFERNRPALGGALLAFMVLSKISPGVLGIVLLAQRRWRATAWTVGFAVLFVALSVIGFGLEPISSFLTYTLPRLSSGEVFAFMDDTDFSIITNTGPFGLPFKLKLLGLDVGDPWVIARHIGHVYSAILVVLAVIAGRRKGDRRNQAIIWMSLLVLAALQSPFAPGYTTIGLLWAIILLTMEVRNLWGGLGLVFIWVLINVVFQGVSIKITTVQSIFQSAATIGIPIWLILRTPVSPIPGPLGHGAGGREGLTGQERME